MNIIMDMDRSLDKMGMKTSALDTDTGVKHESEELEDYSFSFSAFSLFSFPLDVGIEIWIWDNNIFIKMIINIITSHHSLI